MQFRSARFFEGFSFSNLTANAVKTLAFGLMFNIKMKRFFKRYMSQKFAPFEYLFTTTNFRANHEKEIK